MSETKRKRLAELIESTQRFLQETAPKPPPIEVDPDDWRSDFIVGVADGEIFGVADDELLADLLSVEAGSMAVPQVKPLACAACGATLACITHYVDGRPVCPACFEACDELPGDAAQAVIAAQAGDDVSEKDWRAYDAAMCAHCQCYATGEERPECLAAGRPLCGPLPVARHELPLTHSLFLAPRPFSQLARRHYRLFGGICAGYNAFLAGRPYYHVHRRRPARRSARHAILCQLRSERGLLAQLARRVRTKLPPMLYDRVRAA